MLLDIISDCIGTGLNNVYSSSDEDDWASLFLGSEPIAGGTTSIESIYDVLNND